MSQQITTAFVQQYRSNVMMLVQQRGSRLRDAVRVEPVEGEFAYFDQIGPTAAIKRISRHADTPLVETPHARRRVGQEDYEWADLIDKQDKVRLLIDPTSAYTMAASNAMLRAMDDVIITAATGISFVGKTGSAAVSFPATQRILLNATGLTIAKLLAAKETLDASENDPDEKRYIALPAKEVTTLLNTTEIKSADFNTVKALAGGQINSFLGFDFIRTQRLLLNASGNRSCLAWRKSGLLLGVGESPMADIGPRRDKSNAMQVYYAMSLGATRMEEEAVIEIETPA